MTHNCITNGALLFFPQLPASGKTIDNNTCTAIFTHFWMTQICCLVKLIAQLMISIRWTIHATQVIVLRTRTITNIYATG